MDNTKKYGKKSMLVMRKHPTEIRNHIKGDNRFQSTSTNSESFNI